MQTDTPGYRCRKHWSSQTACVRWPRFRWLLDFPSGASPWFSQTFNQSRLSASSERSNCALCVGDHPWAIPAAGGAPSAPGNRHCIL